VKVRSLPEFLLSLCGVIWPSRGGCALVAMFLLFQEQPGRICDRVRNRAHLRLAQREATAVRLRVGTSNVAALFRHHEILFSIVSHWLLLCS